MVDKRRRWTDEMWRTLDEMIRAGETQIKIASVLGVNKNSVAGAANRRRALLRGGASVDEAMRPPAARTTVAQNVQEVAASLVEHRIVLPPREVGECKWPIGEVGAPDFHFCCDAVLSGKVYCEKHCSVAYLSKADWQRSNYHAIRMG